MGCLRIGSYGNRYSFLMLELKHISKSFPGVKALQDVSLVFNAGEVHALCGENGAGKSTLMNIITGNLLPDAGLLLWKEKPVQIQNVLQAQQMGISIVYQERSLSDSLSVAENIFPVNQPKTKTGLIDYKTLYSRTQQLLNELKLSDIAPATLTGRLSAAEKGMVEIAKALARQPQLLILDEPTASITAKETATLFTIIRALKEKGVAIIYISHRMAEIRQIADKVSVLKDGIYQGTVSADTPTRQIIKMMVGRELMAAVYESQVQDTIKLKVENLSGKGFQDISFSVYKGEILGIAGLLGAGRTELAKAIFGDTAFYKGAIFMDGEKYLPRHPSDAIETGIAYLPDERKTEGLFLDRSVAENMMAASLQKGRYNSQAVAKQGSELAKQFGVRTPTVKQEIRKLSGGNQQKVVIAKWMATQPELLMVNEPTHGVDVGAKADIYKILKEFTASGKSILMISSELPELLLMADRIAVMYNGRIQAILNKAEATEEKITALASGIE